MAQRLKITPRARRAAREKGLSLNGLRIEGTGYLGGICEKDILSVLALGHTAQPGEGLSQAGKAAAGGKTRATPLARKIAVQEGVDITRISGTGINGKVQKADVLARLAQDWGETSAGGQASQTDRQSAAVAAEATEGSGQAAMLDGKEVLRAVPYKGIRKIIGDRLSQSKFTAPHLYFTQKVNLEKLLKLRKEINTAQELKTSVTDYIARACILTLQKYPGVNASLIDGMLYEYKSVNLGIAVAAPSGLIVPVVKSAEQKKLLEISAQASFLVEKARNGKLSPDEYSGGTFTVSNLGMFGIENFTAIINPPESAILAVSATKDEPFVQTNEQGEKLLSIKPMMNITLSADHRLIDGLLAAQFVTEVKRMLENPLELLL